MRMKKYHKKIYDIKTWQNIHVKQLSYTRNLILILATASLAFTINTFKGQNYGVCQEYLIKVAGILFLFSIACGLLIAIFESKNYRLKYKIARNIERDMNFKEDEKKCTHVETCNKHAFRFQIAFFLSGIIMLFLLIF